VTGTLLAVDGDSFAHRAYHSMPKSVRLNAVVGFTNMMLRLWQAEQPEAVLVAWDTLEVPTYRHTSFEAYQSGRIFEDSIVEQLALLPRVTDELGFITAKAPGYEADDFLAAAAQEWPGPVLVATSDRDAYQLANDRVTILAPTRGVSEIRRIGPPEVREIYGVEPEQVPDLIALRGDPSDKLPACCASTARSKRRSQPGGSRRRRRICGSSVESPRWTPLPPFLPSEHRLPTGRGRPPTSGTSSASTVWPTD
jgi:DNA polymerase-1